MTTTTTTDSYKAKSRKYSIPTGRIDQICPALTDFVVAVGSMRIAQARAAALWKSAVDCKDGRDQLVAIADGANENAQAFAIQVDNMVISLLGRDLAEIVDGSEATMEKAKSWLQERQLPIVGIVLFYYGRPFRWEHSEPAPRTVDPGTIALDVTDGFQRVAVGGTRECGAIAWQSVTNPAA